MVAVWPAAGALRERGPTVPRRCGLGTNDTDIFSLDLGLLTQHIVDKADWAPGATVGFLLSPAAMQGWAMFADSSAGTGAASLELAYTPP